MKYLCDSFLHSFVLLQYRETFSGAIDTLRLIFRVFGNKYLNRDVRIATKALLSKIKQWQVSEKCDIKESDAKWALRSEPDDDVYSHKIKTSIRQASPWMSYFKSLSELEISKSDFAGKRDNPYYSVASIEYLLNHWLSMFPFWCMAVSALYSFKKKNSWYSNSHVKNWFASVKARQLRKSSIGARVLVSKFVHGQREGILEPLKRFQLSEEREHPQQAKKRGIPSMHDVEECWGKRTRARFVKPSTNKTDKLFSKLCPNSSNSELSKTPDCD
jgi:hypothetical protein